MGNAEHLPFKGECYTDGICGKRIAIVGYSHHHDSPNDDGEFTRQTIGHVVSGTWKPRFFTVIRNAFGYSSHAEFWSRVLFFNYIPTMIGVASDRYKWASDQQATRANERFLEILAEYAPDCVFVFTRKSRLGALDLGFSPMVAPLQGFVTATLTTPVRSEIYRLRHPQGADGKHLRAAIAVALPCIQHSS
ncbi:hypothetical protein [Sinorhizobium meliloti]|uniref:hypothetical protein n=1 Tax=Rhizobium meliloti TaxID=382 RepID=UPI00299E035F|nr:hypothetical protein [Sinorhizobium meliloti]